jgi:hypothetical protein
MSGETIKCPWCGQVATSAAWELFDATTDVAETECCHCGEPIKVLREICITYKVIKIQPADRPSPENRDVQELLDQSVPDENLPAGA